MASFFQDLRFGLRTLRRSPGFVALTVVVLAIGIGANAVIFSIVNGFFLRPTPGVDDPSRLIELRVIRESGTQTTMSFPEFLALRDGATPIRHLVGWEPSQISLSEGGLGERRSVMYVSANYFDAVGVVPAMGRTFLPDEDEGPGGHPVTVLSHRLWTERFGSDPDIVGKTLSINRTPYTVVGVAPDEFKSHNGLLAPDLWLPMMQYPPLSGPDSWITAPGTTWLQVFGRLAPESTIEQANASIVQVFERLTTEFPANNWNRSGNATRLGTVPSDGRGAILGFMSILMAFTLLVLVTTCSNVAGMILARSAARTQEIAVRLALGSGRGRVVRQLVTESLVLFLVGGAIGSAITFWVSPFLDINRLPFTQDVRMGVDFSPDPRILTFSIGITLVCGLVFGLLPALNVTRNSLVTGMKDDAKAGGVKRSRLRRVFVGGQVAVSLVLLVSASLLVRTLQEVGSVDIGFDPEDVYLTNLDLSLDGYDTPEEGYTLFRQIIDEAAAQPGVQSAAVAIDLPLDMSDSNWQVLPEGWNEEQDGGLRTSYHLITPTYFETLRIPVEEGRTFTDDDRSGTAPVMIVSRVFADEAWPGERAIGRTVELGDVRYAVVGVAGDVKNELVSEPFSPAVYMPLAQRYEASAALVVRVDPLTANPANVLRTAVERSDPSLSLTRVVALDALARLGTLPQRAAAHVSAWLGLIAFVLSGVGLYGVVAFSVVQRTREIGIRMALGADRGQVVRRVLRSGVGYALPGVIIGGIAAVAVGYLMQSLLLGVSPVDVVALGGVAVLLVSLVGIATYIPARRASRIDPQQALRYE